MTEGPRGEAYSGLVRLKLLDYILVHAVLPPYTIHIGFIVTMHRFRVFSPCSLELDYIDVTILGMSSPDRTSPTEVFAFVDLQFLRAPLRLHTSSARAAETNHHVSMPSSRGFSLVHHSSPPAPSPEASQVVRQRCIHPHHLLHPYALPLFDLVSSVLVVLEVHCRCKVEYRLELIEEKENAVSFHVKSRIQSGHTVVVDGVTDTE
jgi:hypothetical protein